MHAYKKYIYHKIIIDFWIYDKSVKRANIYDSFAFRKKIKDKKSTNKKSLESFTFEAGTIKKDVNNIPIIFYSTVTDFAKLRGWSTLHSRITAI